MSFAYLKIFLYLWIRVERLWFNNRLLNCSLMDFFDILWLLICVGLPVVTGIMSASDKKKKAAEKAGSVPPQPGELDWKDIVKSIAEELKEANSGADDDESDVKDVPAAPVPEPVRPAVPVEAVPRFEPQSVSVKSVPDTVRARPAVTRKPAAAENTDNVTEKVAEKEKIDLRKLVVYSTIMEPKFRE